MEPREKKPLVLGKPKSTEELNPDLPKQEKVNQPNVDNILSALSAPDYMPLLRSYKDIIEALDKNVNYLERRTHIIDKKVNLTFLFLVILYVFMILKVFLLS